MKISEKIINNLAVIKIEGDIVLGNASRQGSSGFLDPILSRFFRDGVDGVLLDVEHLGMADSAFLGEIVATFGRCKGRGIGFGLLRPTGKFAEHIKTTRVVEILPIFQDEEVAMVQFAEGARKRGSSRSCGDTDPDGHHHFDG